VTKKERDGGVHVLAVDVNKGAQKRWGVAHLHMKEDSNCRRKGPYRERGPPLERLRELKRDVSRGRGLK